MPRSSNGSGCWPFTPAIRVQIPYGVLRFKHGLLVKLDITRRFERRIPGSNLGRAAELQDLNRRRPGDPAWTGTTRLSVQIRSPGFSILNITQPGRSTVENAVLISRRRRFDSFSGYSKETQSGDVQWTRCSDGYIYTRLHMGSWCNGITAVF